MIEQWLRWDGPLMDGLERMAQLIVLSLLWLLGCLPGITLLTSCAALYDAVSGSFRNQEGSPWREFLKSYRHHLVRGIPASLVLLLPGGLLAVNLRILSAGGQELLLAMNSVLLAVLLLSSVYVGPVLSRFRLGPVKSWELAFVLCLRYLPHSLWMGLGTAALAALQLYVLPAAAVLLLPAPWCLLLSKRMEKQLDRFGRHEQ